MVPKQPTESHQTPEFIERESGKIPLIFCFMCNIVKISPGKKGPEMRKYKELDWVDGCFNERFRVNM